MLFVVTEKKAILNLRLEPKVRDDFAVAARLRGASMSGLLHQFIVRTIREEREAEPHAFRTRTLKAASSKIVGRIQPGDDAIERRRIQRELDKPLDTLAHRKRKAG